jgi:hypothetical protein
MREDGQFCETRGVQLTKPEYDSGMSEVHDDITYHEDKQQGGYKKGFMQSGLSVGSGGSFASRPKKRKSKEIDPVEEAATLHDLLFSLWESACSQLSSSATIKDDPQLRQALYRCWHLYQQANAKWPKDCTTIPMQMFVSTFGVAIVEKGINVPGLLVIEPRPGVFKLPNPRTKTPILLTDVKSLKQFKVQTSQVINNGDKIRSALNLLSNLHSSSAVSLSNSIRDPLKDALLGRLG